MPNPKIEEKMLSIFKKSIKYYLHSMRHRLSKHLFAESLLKKKGLESRLSDIEILAIGS